MKEFVEKLIGRLEEEISWYETHGCNEDLKRGIIGANRHTISIVNQLAEEYNNGFCEWKLDGVYLLCQHNTELVISCLEEEKHRYTYCPYCGKKIKVVE